MVAEDVNPLWLAQSRLRRRRYDDCIGLCTAALQKNPLDQVWMPGYDNSRDSATINLLLEPSNCEIAAEVFLLAILLVLGFPPTAVVPVGCMVPQVQSHHS